MAEHAGDARIGDKFLGGVHGLRRVVLVIERNELEAGAGKNPAVTVRVLHGEGRSPAHVEPDLGLVAREGSGTSDPDGRRLRAPSPAPLGECRYGDHEKNKASQARFSLAFALWLRISLARGMKDTIITTATMM